jgi:multicomponent Na+:H+ antiporter subunit E
MFLLNVLLALVWVALTADFRPSNFAVGFVLAYLLLALLERPLASFGYLRRVRSVAAFIGFFLWQLLIANLRVAYTVLSLRPNLVPGIVAIPLSITRPAAIALLANVITLTPGTLSLDISSDRRVLYVHTFAVGDVERFRASIKQGFEQRILEIMR